MEQATGNARALAGRLPCVSKITERFAVAMKN